MIQKLTDDAEKVRQFNKITTPTGKTGYEAYIAVWRNGSDEILIGSPTMKILKRVWEGVTDTLLNEERAQFV